jgi:DNA-binding transcriptional LysR family regulator
MIPPADMVLFAAVVREGGFTRAAAKLGLSKQTVSERIGKLEARLGARLLERTTRRLRPTDAGAVYYERCAAIAAQIDEANAEVQRRQAEPVGLLRLSAPVLFGRRFLAPVIAAYLARHPKARVEVLLADRRVNLVEEGIDLAIRIGALEDSSLTARKIGEGHVYYVASPRYLGRRRAPTPRGLAGERCIALRPHETWEAGGASVKVDPVLVAGDLEIACEAAIAGVGIARLPTLVAWEAIRDGRLRVLFGREPALVRPVYAVYPSRQGLAAKVRVFVEALAAIERPELWTGRQAPGAGRAAR